MIHHSRNSRDEWLGFLKISIPIVKLYIVTFLRCKHLAGYEDDGFLFFVLIIFNDESPLCAFLNVREEAEQRIPRVTEDS